MRFIFHKGAAKSHAIILSAEKISRSQLFPNSERYDILSSVKKRSSMKETTADGAQRDAGRLSIKDGRA